MGFLKYLVPKRFRKKELVIPVVRMHGAIMAGGNQFRPLSILLPMHRCWKRPLPSRTRQLSPFP